MLRVFKLFFVFVIFCNYEARAKECSKFNPETLCLGVKFVSSGIDDKSPPFISEEKAVHLLELASIIWKKPCNIQFQLDEYKAMDRKQLGGFERVPPDFLSLVEEEKKIRLSLGSDSSLLVIQEWGPLYLPISNDSPEFQFFVAHTEPGSPEDQHGTFLFGTHSPNPIIHYNYINGVLLAHEFGHYLSLPHNPDSNNLMTAELLGPIRLTQEQCQQARETVFRNFKKMLR